MIWNLFGGQMYVCRGLGKIIKRTRQTCRRIGSPIEKLSLVLSKASNAYVLNVSPEERTSEIPCKPTGEKIRVS